MCVSLPRRMWRSDLPRGCLSCLSPWILSSLCQNRGAGSDAHVPVPHGTLWPGPLPAHSHLPCWTPGTKPPQPWCPPTPPHAPDPRRQVLSSLSLVGPQGENPQLMPSCFYLLRGRLLTGTTKSSGHLCAYGGGKDPDSFSPTMQAGP